jgi:FAD synthase
VKKGGSGATVSFAQINMKHFHWNETIGETERFSLALGAFDAIHLGHRHILEHADAVAYFNPLPAQILQHNFEGCVRTERQRLEIFESLHLKVALSIDFSYDISKITGDVFLEEILKRIGVRKLITGEDFRLGHGRLWGKNEIAGWSLRRGIAYEAVPLTAAGDEIISSSRIRQLIQRGNFEKAARLMGASYCLDLGNIPFEEREERFIYNLSYCKQVLPYDGLYTVSGGVVTIKEKKLYSRDYADEIVFIKRVEKE